MSETSRSIPIEVLDMLPQDCRDCPVARFTLQSVRSSRQAVAKVAEDIQAKCSGWSGEESPYNMAPVVEGEGEPALLVSAVIEKNCPYSRALSE